MARTKSDAVTPERRALMQRVKQRDTAPELEVRRQLFALGLRFRLQRRDLPGTPDIVLPSRRLAIFVHGCFWHRHHNCPKATTPKLRAAFWAEKFEANVARDRAKASALRKAGWKVATVWECETTDLDRLSVKLARMTLARQ